MATDIIPMNAATKRLITNPNRNTTMKVKTNAKAGLYYPCGIPG